MSMPLSEFMFFTLLWGLTVIGVAILIAAVLA
jgi:hypothetical protein